MRRTRMTTQIARRQLISRAALFAGVAAVMPLAQARGGAPSGAVPAASPPAAPTAAAGAPAAPTTAAAAPTAIQAAVGKGSTVINFWNGLTGADGAGMVRIVDRYAQANPNVTVKIQMIPWATFYNKLSASLVAGDPPEMWIQHSEDVIRFDSKGLEIGRAHV